MKKWEKAFDIENRRPYIAATDDAVALSGPGDGKST